MQQDKLETGRVLFLFFYSVCMCMYIFTYIIKKTFIDVIYV